MGVDGFNDRSLGARAAVAMVVALVASALAAAPAQAALAECPSVMLVDDIVEGSFGTGYTVSKGTTPEPFTVEILGVMENGIGPGRDLIVVEATSPAITKAGGIWSGMSGSPVYVGGELVGAVAFGLSYGPSSVGGVTPAEDMLNIAARPTASAAPEAGRVTLNSEIRTAIADNTGVARAKVSSSMTRLTTPLSVSGVGDRVMREIAKTVEREELPLIPYAGASTSAAPAPSDVPPEAGGNFAAAISYGDVTFAGVGTTTYVCEGKVLAFGHPFFFLPQGSTILGANHADAITIVNDPTYGSFKLASVTGTVGTIDQDRFAGIRAIIGDYVTTIPITSHVEIEGEPTERDGASEALISEYVPMVALTHLLSNIDFTRDAITAGSAELAWTITGTTAAGDTWELNRSNLFSSDFDINYMSLIELEQQIYSLFYNGFEEIEFSGIDVDASIADEVRQYSMSEVLVSKDGVNYVKKRRVSIPRGGTVFLRATLEPFEGGDDVVVDLQIPVPKKVRNEAFIQLAGGGNDPFGDEYFYLCMEYGEYCAGEGDEEQTIEDLIESFESAPKNNDLTADLYSGRGKKLSTSLESFDKVISGFRNIRVLIRGSGGGGVLTDGGGSSGSSPGKG